MGQEEDGVQWLNTCEDHCMPYPCHTTPIASPGTRAPRSTLWEAELIPPSALLQESVSPPRPTMSSPSSGPWLTSFHLCRVARYNQQEYWVLQTRKTKHTETKTLAGCSLQPPTQWYTCP